jgi:glycosyltransferase involved in cell wall biosynthesis
MKTQKELVEAKNKDTQERPKVAIVILNWNGWKDTIECLESVFRNTYPNYQVIVVDNGSTDGSIEKIKAWADGKQEVLTPEPTHPLYHLSHPPVKKPIPYIYYTREEAEKGGDLKLEEKVTKEWQEKLSFSFNSDR